MRTNNYQNLINQPRSWDEGVWPDEAGDYFPPDSKPWILEPDGPDEHAKLLNYTWNDKLGYYATYIEGA